MENTFLPSDYETPKSESSYLKLKEGSIKFRIVSPAVVGYEYWTNPDSKHPKGLPVRLKENPTEKPSDVRLKDDGSYEIKHFWAFSVLDRDTGRVKILEITQISIMRQISAYLENEDWGDPTKYDLTITGTGDGKERRYIVQPSPHKELTVEEKSAVARTEVKIEALFTGENPFEKEGVKLAEVPF
jgi:hypothetical protein